MSKISKLLPIFTTLFFLGTGYAFGKLETLHESPEGVVHDLKDYKEISIIHLKSIEGDQIKLEISGPARILWNEEMVENDGDYGIPLSQLETENDRSFTEFTYVGNAKTMKFYPADSYPARGVQHVYRRFFQSKTEAIDQGFIASKLVK